MFPTGNRELETKPTLGALESEAMVRLPATLSRAVSVAQLTLASDLLSVVLTRMLLGQNVTTGLVLSTTVKDS